MDLKRRRNAHPVSFKEDVCKKCIPLKVKVRERALQALTLFFSKMGAIARFAFACCAFVFISSPIQGQQKPGRKPVYAMPNSCGIIVNAGPDITICAGEGKVLNASVSGSTQYSWEPPDGLSNPNILNPVANPASTTNYTLTARAVSGNRITNGGFETGNINPATSQYTPFNAVNDLIASTGGYMVMSVPQIAIAFGCTPNIGAFTMVITPTGSSSNIWCQTIPVFQNTDYKIDYKLFGIPYLFSAPPSIGLKINGSLIGTVDAISGLCLEASGSFTWNSAAATSATICFANYGGTGPLSMCAIDDIVVRECCEEQDEVTVTVYELLADILPPDEINCFNRPLRLDASGSSSGPGISYLWTTRNGRILSGDRTLTPVIDSPGVYTLKITGPFGCEVEQMIEVKGSVTPPDISTKKEDITCQNNMGRIEAISKSQAPTYEWTGPGGYYSTRATNFNIQEPGTYTVKVTDDYGCTNTASVEIEDLRTELYVEVSGDSLGCSKDTAVLRATSLARKPIYRWKGPGGYQKDSSDRAVVRDTGWYYLTTTDSLGCKELDSFYVPTTGSHLTVALSADTLTCNRTFVQLRLVADTTATVSWKGPGNFSSTERMPVVSESGWYYVELMTADGCRAIDSVIVFKSADVPDIFLSPADTLRCNRPDVTLTGGSLTAGVSVLWNTPSGDLRDQTSITTSLPGNYTFTVTAPNGCSAQTSVTIAIDTVRPVFTLKADTLNCRTDSAWLRYTGADATSYQWSGPSGLISNVREIRSGLPGWHRLVAIANNGCSYEDSVYVSIDRSLPILALQADTITCTRTTVSPTVATDSTAIAFHWTGPGGFSSNVKSIQVGNSGIYTLTVIAANGCSDSAILNIPSDTVHPGAFLQADTITCKQIGKIQAGMITGNIIRMQWVGPGGFSIQSPSSDVVLGGTYTFTLWGTNGCTFTDSVLVIQKDRIPDLRVSGDTITCSRLSVPLNASTSTTGVSVQWNGPNGFRSDQLRPVVSDSGWYTIQITDSLGCSASQIIYIGQKTTPPLVKLWYDRDSITCADSVAAIARDPASGSGILTWSGPGGLVASTDTIATSRAGWYKLLITDAYGCSSSDSFLLRDSRRLPSITLEPDTITCRRNQLTLRLNTPDAGLVFDWSGPLGFSSAQQNPVIAIPGNYLVTATNSSGCRLSLSVTIVADTTKPDLSLSADTINCLRDRVPVKAGSSLQGFTMSWNGPNGFSYSLPQFNTDKPGLYVCKIINPRTGCSTTDSILVVADTGRIHFVDASPVHANCQRETGYIAIHSITGGKAPYVYSADGGANFVTDLTVLPLSPGIHPIVVRDANGCTYDLSLEILREGGVRIDLLPSLELKAGESRKIKLNILSDPGAVRRISWDPADQLDCSDCLEPLLTASYEGVIRVTVTDTNGCTSEAALTLRILKEVKVYFPNAFSPNGDNINDAFYPIDHSNAATIESFQIFDRWGNLVFSNERFAANMPDQGWNGRGTKGKRNLPGVYLYSAKIKTDDGFIVLSGDVHLIE